MPRLFLFKINYAFPLSGLSMRFIIYFVAQSSFARVMFEVMLQTLMSLMFMYGEQILTLTRFNFALELLSNAQGKRKS